MINAGRIIFLGARIVCLLVPSLPPTGCCLPLSASPGMVVSAHSVLERRLGHRLIPQRRRQVVAVPEIAANRRQSASVLATSPIANAISVRSTRVVSSAVIGPQPASGRSRVAVASET